MVDSSTLLGEAGESWEESIFEKTFGKVFWVRGSRVGLMDRQRACLCSSHPQVNQKKWQNLRGTRLPGPELELSKLRTSAIKTAPNPYYRQMGLSPARPWPLPPGLTEVSPANVTLLRWVFYLLLRWYTPRTPFSILPPLTVHDDSQRTSNSDP